MINLYCAMSKNLLQLRRLAIFAKVIQLGSFSAASKELSLSRSAVSEQLALLEKAMNKRLIHRTTRKLTLTNEGREILPHAQNILNSIELIDEVNNQESLQGIVRISTTQDFAAKWLVPRLNRFNKVYPDIQFELVLSDMQIDLVDNQLDLAIRIGRVKDENYISRPLFDERAKIIGSRDYFKQHGKPTSIIDLNKHHWILLKQFDRNNQFYLESQHKSVYFAPEKYHICDAAFVKLHMVLAGMGLSVHLTSIATDYINNGQLEIIMPEWSSEIISYSLIYPSRKQIPLRTRYVIDALTQSI